LLVQVICIIAQGIISLLYLPVGIRLRDWFAERDWERWDKQIELRDWFAERDWERWDKQIEKDSEAGKLDFLIKEALNEKKGQVERTVNASDNRVVLEMFRSSP